MLEKGMSLEEIAENLNRQGHTEAAWQRHVVGHQRAESVRLLGRTCMFRRLR